MERALRAGVRCAGAPCAWGVSPGPWWGEGLRYHSASRAPAAAGGDEEKPGPERGGGGQLPSAAPRGGPQAVTRSPQSSPGPRSRPALWHKGYERDPRPAGRESWSWREGDCSGVRKRLEQKPLGVGRTKGSEILFGIAPCSLALSQSRRDLFRLFLKQNRGSQPLVRSEFVLQATARGVPVLEVSRRELDALCRGQVHQGVCLEATPLRFKSLEEAEKPELKNPSRELVWLVLEQIQDPMNLGALLRSAYFLGVDRVVTSQRNSCPLTPTVSKASSGTMEVFDVYSTDDLQSFLKRGGPGGELCPELCIPASCRVSVLLHRLSGALTVPIHRAKTAEGWEVVGTVSRPEEVENVPVTSCLEFQWEKPLIVVIGSEGEGLSLETQLLCHRMLAIPPGRALHPGIESLNVSVATGILLHSICSQKQRHGG